MPWIVRSGTVTLTNPPNGGATSKVQAWATKSATDVSITSPTGAPTSTVTAGSKPGRGWWPLPPFNDSIAPPGTVSYGAHPLAVQLLRGPRRDAPPREHTF